MSIFVSTLLKVCGRLKIVHKLLVWSLMYEFFSVCCPDNTFGENCEGNTFVLKYLFLRILFLWFFFVIFQGTASHIFRSLLVYSFLEKIPNKICSELYVGKRFNDERIRHGPCSTRT